MINSRKIKVCHDVIFKEIFLNEKELLLKMIYDITNISETLEYEEIIPGYELEPYMLDGKVNRSDLLVKINKRYFMNVEINYKHQRNVLVRNMIQLFKIHGQVEKSGMSDSELSLIKVGQVNLNTFANSNNEVLEKGYYINEGDAILKDLLNIWNIDVEKCYKTLYNNKKKEKLPNVVKWGAIIFSNLDDIEITLNKIGDLLTMEEKEKLIKRIDDIKNDNRIIQEWMVIENNRMRDEDILNTAKYEARSEGLKEGRTEGRAEGRAVGRAEGIEDTKVELIKNMLIKDYSYDNISELIGKTVEEIKEIEKNMKA